MDLFSELADKYDSLRSENPPYLSAILSLIKRFNNKWILDLGCGTGLISEKILKVFEVGVIAIDISPQMLCRFAEKQTNAHLLCASAEKLPFVNDVVDGVICIYLLHLLKEPRKVICAIRNMMTKGWILIVTAPHNFIRKHPLNLFFPSFKDIDLSRFPAEEQIINWLVEAGFNSVETQYCGVFRKWYSKEYLEKTKSKFISTLRLLSEEEFARGIKQMEEFINSQEYDIPLPWESFLAIGYV